MKRFFAVMAIGIALGDGAPAQTSWHGTEPTAPAVGRIDPAPEGPPASACQRRLTPDRAVYKSLGEVIGPGACGGPDLVYLESIVASDRSQIAIEPPATLRCEMAEAIVNWVRQDLAPGASALGGAVAGIENYDSYDCRGRNRIAGAKLSEHGRANALDIRSFRLKDGHIVRPTDIAVTRDFRLAMKTTACARFMTVLGPGSDGFHEDHIHVDLADRRSGYRTCQWDLHDGEPQPEAATALVAGPEPVPLPRSRPFVSAINSRLPLPVTESRSR